jgi:hypothetical protein
MIIFVKLMWYYIVLVLLFPDLKNMHERYNPKMRWEIAKKKQSETSTHDNLGDFSGSCHQCGNHSRDAEIYKKNLKSQTTVKTETGKTITR